MKTKIAIQGELGAYSHLAAKEIFGDVEISPCKTFEDVFALIKSDNLDIKFEEIEFDQNNQIITAKNKVRIY